MVDKVEITDPYKVDPTLQEKTEAQLRHEITLREMALEKIEYGKKAQARKAELDEINAANELVVEGLTSLYKRNSLPDDVRALYTTRSGAFAPHLKHKPIEMMQLLAKEALAQNPKKTRKPRKARGA